MLHLGASKMTRVSHFLTHDGVELLGEEELTPNFNGMNFDEGPVLEESAPIEHLQSPSLAPSSHAFLSLDMQDLSSIVEEDSLLVNEELCEASEEPTVEEPCVSSSVGTPSDVT